MSVRIKSIYLYYKIIILGSAALQQILITMQGAVCSKF